MSGKIELNYCELSAVIKAAYAYWKDVKKFNDIRNKDFWSIEADMVNLHAAIESIIFKMREAGYEV